jgi:hypothetical protein
MADDLFAVPVAGNAELQRLADAAKRLLVIPDAHRTVIDVA